MEYYNRISKCYQMIDKLIAEQTPKDIIYFKVATMFGFSEKFVDKRIEQLDKFVKATKEQEAVKNVSQQKHKRKNKQ